MRRSDRIWAGLLLGPLALAIAFSYARIVVSLDDTPRDDDYVAARAILERQSFAKGRDCLAVLPAWSLRPLTVLGDLEPMSADDLARRPLHRCARLFVLVEPTSDDAHDALVRARGEPAFSDGAGRVRIERWDLVRTATFDFTAQLERAEVRIVGADEATCDQRAQRPGFQCAGRPNWQRVTREWLLVSENADLAVWSHPPPKGQRLEIAWSDVALGDSIVVRAGHTRDGADNASAPVRIHVEVDGERIATVERKPAFAFRTDTIDTVRLRARTARVAFVVETDNEGSNHFAWDAYVVGR